MTRFCGSFFLISDVARNPGFVKQNDAGFGSTDKHAGNLDCNIF